MVQIFSPSNYVSFNEKKNDSIHFYKTFFFLLFQKLIKITKDKTRKLKQLWRDCMAHNTHIIRQNVDDDL